MRNNEMEKVGFLVVKIQIVFFIFPIQESEALWK